MKNKLKKFQLEKIIIYLLIFFFLLNNNKYLSNVSNNNLYIILEIILFIILFLFTKNIKKIENKFLFLGIILGIMYLLFIPFCKVPDENTHFARTYSITKGELISKTDNKQAYTYLPFSISNICISNNYDEYLKNIKKSISKEYTIFNNTALYNFMVYLPQSLGVFICRLFHLNKYFMLYIPRLFNLLCYLALIYYSIKIIPFCKEIILLISLNPMSLQEAASFSPDSLTICSSIFLISYIMYLSITKKGKLLTKKQYTVLLLMSILFSLCKIVYIPLCLLNLILPLNKFKSKKDYYLKKLTLILIPILINLLWLKIASKFLIVFQSGVNTPMQVKYILFNPFNYLKIIFNTTKINGRMFLTTMFGSNLNLYNIYTSNLYSYISLILIIILSILYKKSINIKFKIKEKIIIFFIFISIIFLIFTSLYVQWTPLHSKYIDGIQGRYFIPILLLIPFLFTNSKNNNIKIMEIDYKNINKLLFIFLIIQNINALAMIIINYI